MQLTRSFGFDRADGYSVAALGYLALYLLAPTAWRAIPAALGFLALAVWKPRAALTTIPVTLPFYLMPRQLGGLEVSLPEVALLLTLGGTALRVGLDRLRGAPALLRPRPTAFDAPLALLLAAALLSLLVTQYARLSLRELRVLILEPAIFFYLVVWLVSSQRQAQRLVQALLLGALAAALLALGQYALDVGPTQVEGVRRVSALYQSPNHLALLLGRALPIALAGLLLSGPPWRWGYGAVLLPMGAALLATFSLGGWLGTAAGFTLVLAGVSRRTLLAGLLGALVLVAVTAPLLGVERISSHLNPSSGSTTAIRLELWGASLAMLRDHPLLGIGLDNFLYLYRQEYLPPGVVAEPNLSHPHNLALHFWLALGLPGLAAIGWLLARFAQAMRAALRESSRTTRMLALGLSGSMVDFVVHGLGDNSYFLVDMAFVFWLTLALAHFARVLQFRDHSP